MSGGFMPISGILADADVMSVLKTGDHGSTFGGCSLAMAVCKASLEVIVEENLVENALNMGHIIRDRFLQI
jgi:ornithine--oxo-acid transaminase